MNSSDEFKLPTKYINDSYFIIELFAKRIENSDDDGKRLESFDVLMRAGLNAIAKTTLR